jgi:hypothetical protein
MRNRLHVILGVLFVVALLFDAYAWGGLSKTPSMGRIVTDASTRELALAGVYVPLGKALLDVSGLAGPATAYAESEFAPVEAHVLANPAAAMETLVTGMPSLVRVGYYGAPLMLAAFALAFWRRPRVVRSMVGRR